MFRAGEPDSEASSHQALSGFCEAYWPPLYSFLRHRGHSSADAQDLVQGFFARLLEQNTLSHADRQKGRLRTFLLGSLENFLYSEYDRARALKRARGSPGPIDIRRPHKIAATGIAQMNSREHRRLGFG